MEASPEVVSIDPTEIAWVETLSRSKIKVRDATVVRLSFAQDASVEPEFALRIKTSNGRTCVVPLRAVARIDLKDV